MREKVLFEGKLLLMVMLLSFAGSLFVQAQDSSLGDEYFTRLFESRRHSGWSWAKQNSMLQGSGTFVESEGNCLKIHGVLADAVGTTVFYAVATADGAAVLGYQGSARFGGQDLAYYGTELGGGNSSGESFSVDTFAPLPEENGVLELNVQPEGSTVSLSATVPVNRSIMDKVTAFVPINERLSFLTGPSDNTSEVIIENAILTPVHTAFELKYPLDDSYSMGYLAAGRSYVRLEDGTAMRSKQRHFFPGWQYGRDYDLGYVIFDPLSEIPSSFTSYFTFGGGFVIDVPLSGESSLTPAGKPIEILDVNMQHDKGEATLRFPEDQRAMRELELVDNLGQSYTINQELNILSNPWENTTKELPQLRELLLEYEDSGLVSWEATVSWNLAETKITKVRILGNWIFDSGGIEVAVPEEYRLLW